MTGRAALSVWLDQGGGLHQALPGHCHGNNNSLSRSQLNVKVASAQAVPDDTKWLVFPRPSTTKTDTVKKN